MKMTITYLILALSFHLHSAENDYHAPKANLSFDELAAKLIKLTKAKTSINNDVYDYVLNYDLYKSNFGISVKYGEAQSFFRGEWNEIQDDSFDTAKKQLIISGVSELGQLNRGRAFIRYSCSVEEYEKPGVNRGQYQADIEFLKALDGKILIIANSSHINSPEDIIHDVNVSIKSNSMTIDYPAQYYSGESIRKKIEINLNETLDCNLYYKSQNMNNYKKIAFYRGGSL